MHFTAKQDKKIAVLPMGYGKVFHVYETKARFLNRVCCNFELGGDFLDAIVVDIDNIPASKTRRRSSHNWRASFQLSYFINREPLKLWTPALERVKNLKV